MSRVFKRFFSLYVCVDCVGTPVPSSLRKCQGMVRALFGSHFVLIRSLLKDFIFNN